MPPITTMHQDLQMHRPADRFDVHEVERFRTAASRTQVLIVDLGRVRFIDQTALRALVEARAALIDRGGELWIDGLSQAACVTFDLAGLSEAFPLLVTIDKAA